MTPERLDELLALEATQGLTPAEQAELDALLAASPDTDPDSLEYAAAAIHLAFLGKPEPLPATLAAKLQRAAPQAAPAVPASVSPATRPTRNWESRLGWVVAACLAGVLAFTYWPKTPQKQLTVAELRDQLRPQATAFVGKKDAISGDIVWSNAKQEGYLEVRGLPALDPKKEQYQLWIVDPSRKQPIDGGVFDVNPDGTVLVRIRNPIVVKEAKLFAITKEPAGGVVVSEDGAKGKFELVLTPQQG
jgi:anti-sigma-K factor RskA